MCYRENPGEMGADDALRSEIREKISLRGQFRVRLPSEEPEEQCAWAQCLPGARSHRQHGLSYLAVVLGTTGLAQYLAHSKCSTNIRPPKQASLQDGKLDEALSCGTQGAFSSFTISFKVPVPRGTPTCCKHLQHRRDQMVLTTVLGASLSLPYYKISKNIYTKFSKSQG